jgi:Glycosyl hydrolase family 26
MRLGRAPSILAMGSIWRIPGKDSFRGNVRQLRKQRSPAMIEMKRRHAISLATAALGATVLPDVANSGPLPSRSGLSWASGATTSDPDAFVAAVRRGRKLDVFTTFGGHSTWAGMRRRYTALVSLLDPAQGNRQEVIVVTYPIFPDEQSPRSGGPAVWQAAARGDFDAHHIATADGFKRFSQKFIFRVGHEWNCCFPWRCLTLDMAIYYTTYFRRIVDILRARHPTCLIDWCSVKRGKTEIGIHEFYPGGDWVDIVGVDKYDMYPPLRNATEWNKDYSSMYRGGPQGAGAWLVYAKSLGKKLAFSEWAVNNGPSYGGGDNPYFVSQMLKFFSDNAADIAYESYFNRNNITHGWDHLLDPGHNPKATAAYEAQLAVLLSTAGARAFDGLEYIASNPDLIRAFGANAAAGEQHYRTYGQAENRPTDTFDAVLYLAKYADLRAAFGTNATAATIHYISYGFAEGRTDRP